MKVGIVALGKLGTPVAVALSSKHHVLGYDINPNLMKKRVYEYKELGPTLEDDFQEYFDEANISFVPLQELVEQSEIIFVAVQTPHQPLYEGITRLPGKTANFDYKYLIQVAKDLAPLVKPDQVVVIISTVLPGTIREHILPILGGRCCVVYSPLFIAMKTVMHDFFNPEFVLLGGDTHGLEIVKKFYDNFYGRDLCVTMSIESAELTKVAYNTFISMKIVFANTLMEICHKIPGCDVDSVTSALGKANKRLLSPQYMRGGCGDGGGCHPRDNIAMSWLASELELSHDVFDNIMIARERQSEWLVELMLEYDLPKVILGKSFKAETNITTGSPAILCANLLEEKGVPFYHFDPHIDTNPKYLWEINQRRGGRRFLTEPSVFLVATKHKCFADFPFPEGSIVIDPHRYIKDIPGVEVVRVGESR